MLTVQQREMLVLGQAEVVSKLELNRLRGVEAREAVMVNLMAAWFELIDGKLTVDRFEDLLKGSEAGMCRAIECLGRRDRIRTLEGAYEALNSISGGRGNYSLDIAAACEEALQSLNKARAAE